jgi:hypothetical protein
MNLMCEHFNKPITHELTKWTSCPIRSMCAGCWHLLDTDTKVDALRYIRSCMVKAFEKTTGKEFYEKTKRKK